MKAVLTTRCGCSREFPTTFPPPPEIYVPLDKMAAGCHGWLGIAPTCTDDLPPGETFPVRTFKLQEPAPEHPCETAYYREASTFNPK